MKYVTFDYEEPGEPNNYWHVYSLDTEPENVSFGAMSLLTIRGPNIGVMRSAVAAICTAINIAIETSQ